MRQDTERAITGKRIADEDIYLKEDRFDQPKEVFKFLGLHVAADLRPGDRSALDVGCATGELIHYLKGLCPSLSFMGLDVSAPMIRRARTRLPNCLFETASLTQKSRLTARRFDIVICMGVLQVFDDLTRPMAHLANAVSPKGRLYVVSPMNKSPIDLVSRYRDRRRRPDVWQKGWNLFSREAYAEALRATGRRFKIGWDDFHMPFHLPPKGDPMRTWTEPIGKERFQLVNGAGMLINVSLLTARFP